MDVDNRKDIKSPLAETSKYYRQRYKVQHEDKMRKPKVSKENKYAHTVSD